MTTQTQAPRMQQDLRARIDELTKDLGWDIVAREPLTLKRLGCKQIKQVNQSGLLVNL